MKKNYSKKCFVLLGLLCINTFFAQNSNRTNEIILPITINGKIKNQPINSNLQFIQRNPNQVLASTISPLNQTICSGNPVTNITASSPLIEDNLFLDCITGGAGTYITNANNGIYFDITNSGTVPVRISGLDFVTYASTATTSTSTIPFTFYKTTSVATAVGNYTNAANWTNLGTLSWSVAATALNSGWILTADFGDNGFTLAAGTSCGFYIVSGNTTTTEFKLGYRTSATTGVPISNTNVTVTHRVRGTGLFATDNTARGFYGNVLYHTSTYGYWTRDNTTNVTGTTTAGDAGSGATPFPISGSLTNTTSTSQTVVYTITSYDVNGVKDIQTANITVNPSPINTVTLISNTLTADQAGASYQWFDCNNGNTIIPGETSQSFTPSVNGNYGVTVTLNSCPIDSGCTAVLNSNSFDSNSSFVIYPNPNNGDFYIKSNFDAEIKIINQLGQIIKTFEIGQEEKNIEMKDFPIGIYYLNAVTKEGKTTTKKIAIK